MQKYAWTGRGGPHGGVPCHGTNGTMVNPALDGLQPYWTHRCQLTCKRWWKWMSSWIFTNFVKRRSRRNLQQLSQESISCYCLMTVLNNWAIPKPWSWSGACLERLKLCCLPSCRIILVEADARCHAIQRHSRSSRYFKYFLLFHSQTPIIGLY